MLKTKKSPGFVRIGLFNLLVKTAVAPISFLFSFLVVRYLSSISIETFGVWQYIYVLITGYFTIPADLFSSITSRYSAEGKNVGGIIIINAIAGSISSFAYFLLIPIFMHSAGYNQPIYFYTAILLIVLIYLNKISGSVAIGRSPRLTAISASGFQIVRLLSAIIMMFYLNLSINAVIFAYSLGYLVQIIFNLTFVNARLGIDFKVALSAVRKSIVFIMNYVQLMIEATLVWVVV
ncbi:MAG: teichoic acid transporter, partial [Acidianus infernus]|nr:teichoic acid transporter [Acidianus infernus]